ncbi:MAG: hypothetical protein JNL62_25325 [Bryobacterales bacterium]|nr:hypothetical protein [Bryobacterales bacterium]
MMATDLQAKAQTLIGQLGPAQLAAVIQLLEVMVHNDEDELTDHDIAAVESSREYFRQGGKGLTFEEMVADCGFTMDDVRRTRADSE